MASIKGFRLVPALLALLAAVAGGAGLAAWCEDSAAGTVVLVDRSPSCEAFGGLIEGSLEFRDADLGAALARAASSKGTRRILVYTDAVTSRVPSLPGLPIDVVLRPRRDDVGILGLRLPERVRPGEDFPVEIEVGRTAGPGRGFVGAAVRLLRDGQRVGAGRQLSLERGDRLAVRIRDRVERTGVVRYRAVLQTATGHPANDEREAVLRVGDRRLVLCVGGTPPMEGVDWVEMRAAELAAYLARPHNREQIDAILLTGPLPARAAQEEVVRAVRGGAGLLVVVGRGFSERPLEAVLPLTDKPPAGRAAVLLLDFSGSMAPHEDALKRGVERLLLAFAPSDRVALVAFNDAVMDEQPWTAVRDARWGLGLSPRGNTRLAPALRRAAQLLEQAGSAEKRLFVVSDGQWPDVAEAGELLRGMGDIHTAALFVQEKRHASMFDAAYAAGDDVEGELKALEDKAPDRRIEGPVAVEAGTVAEWLRAGLPPAGSYGTLQRLYPRGVGESVALRAGEAPVLATLEPGGRVVMAAGTDLPLAGLLRACMRPGQKTRLDAWRAGGALRLWAKSDTPLPFVVDGEEVASRPAGPGAFSAWVENASTGPILVRFGEAIRLVLAEEAIELEGLESNSEIAREIARRSGGSLYTDEPPPREGESRGAFYVFLLAGALFVLWSALVRRAG